MFILVHFLCNTQGHSRAENHTIAGHPLDRKTGLENHTLSEAKKYKSHS